MFEGARREELTVRSDGNEYRGQLYTFEDLDRAFASFEGALYVGTTRAVPGFAERHLRVDTLARYVITWVRGNEGVMRLTGVPGSSSRLLGPSPLAGSQSNLYAELRIPWTGREPVLDVIELERGQISDLQSTPLATISSLRMVTEGRLAGCVTARARMASAQTHVGFDFDVAERDGRSQQRFLPLVDSGSLMPPEVDLCVDPCDTSQVGRSYFEFGLPAQPFATRYRTRFGSPVTLTPDPGTKFRATRHLTGRGVSFRPRGNFTVAVQGPDRQEPLEVRTGVGPEEWLRLASATLAFVDEASGTLERQVDGRLMRAEPQTVMSSWVVPPDGSVLVLQSPDSPLFSDPRPVPGHQGLTMLAATPTMEGVCDRGSALPWIPLGEVSGTVDPDAADIEESFVRRERRRVLGAQSTRQQIRGTREGFAVTPDGQRVHFFKGAIVGVDLGSAGTGDQTSRTRIRLAFGGPFDRAPLPDYLVDTLVGERFAVVTRLPEEIRVDAEAVIDGWSFDLSLIGSEPAPPLPPPALIVKFRPGLLRDLLEDPRLWSAAGDLNDFGGNLVALADRLVTHLDTASRLHRDGVAGFESLVRAAEDPDWRGFLFFRAPSSAGADPGAVADAPFLASAIAANRIKPEAHHLGCSVGILTNGATGDLETHSSFFGSLRYSGEVGGHESADAALRVVDLTMIVANTRVVDFHCDVSLDVRRIFGRSVDRAALGPATAGLAFHGALRDGDGGTHFELAPSPDSIRRLPLAHCPIAEIIIGEAKLLTRPDGLPDSDGVASPVSWVVASGWLSTIVAPRADFLSFEAIPFQDLVAAIGGDLDCTWLYSSLDIGAQVSTVMAQAPAPTERAPGTVVVRRRSLAAVLPCLPRSVIRGSLSPKSLGYSPVSTNPPAEPAPEGRDWFGLLTRIPISVAPQLALDLLFSWPVEPCQTGSSGHREGPDNPPPEDPLMAVWLGIDVDGHDYGLSVDLAGVATLGFRSVHLFEDDGNYALELGDLGASVMSLGFPPRGTTTVVVSGIAGDVPDIGWLARYLAPSK